MPNYGDVALNLPPDWSRSRLASGQEFHLTTVGHENGVADAYITNEPDRLHQFKWVNPLDNTEVSIAKSRHYVFVEKGSWTKNPHLWEWTGEGNIVFNGQYQMARDAEWYYKEEEARKNEEKQRRTPGKLPMDERVSALEKQIAARGGTIVDDQGRVLDPLAPEEEPKQKRRR